MEVVELPKGATLTKPHATTKATDDGYADDSDIYRSSEGTFPMVNRFTTVADGATEPRADGMIIVARKRTNESNDPYPYAGVDYDIKMAVQRQQGGDGGLVFIPETNIDGEVWDDSYHPVTGSDPLAPAADATARANSYNGVHDANEPGLEGRTMMLTQWFYKNGTWVNIKSATREKLTDASGAYRFDKVATAHYESTQDYNLPVQATLPDHNGEKL